MFPENGEPTKTVISVIGVRTALMNLKRHKYETGRMSSLLLGLLD